MDGASALSVPHTEVGRATTDATVRRVAWGAMLVASPLFEIIGREYGPGAPVWLPIAQSAALVVLALAILRVPKVRALSRFVFALAALRLGWYFLAPWLARIAPVRVWSQGADWGERLLIARFLTLTAAALMCLTLIGSGMGRRDLFLSPGNIAAPAAPIRFLGLRRPLPWTIFGPALIVVFGIALPLFLYFSLHPNFAAAARVWHFLPWILAVAALNAASEEFQFRCIPLAHLRNVMAPAEAVLLTAVLFGLGHYYGQPSGPIGCLMAGFAGWIWAKSMIETRGVTWAFSIHMVQDIVIFCFLAMAAGK